jgi:uncharacterized caspase-like protein
LFISRTGALAHCADEEVRAAWDSLFGVWTMVRVLLALLALVSFALPSQAEPRRVALVIGNATFPDRTLPTALADAGLIAETLRRAGYRMITASDPDADQLRAAFRTFLTEVEGVGPDGTAVVYISGLGVQSGAETILVPKGATLTRPADLAVEGVRVSDLTRALAGRGQGTRVVVLDVARRNGFPAFSSAPVGLVEPQPEAGLLIAINAQPGTIQPDQSGAYGAYARALAEVLGDAQLSPTEVFQRVRVRVHEATRGSVTPFEVSRLAEGTAQLMPQPEPSLAAAAEPAPPAPTTLAQTANAAYARAIAAGNRQAYRAFLNEHPTHAQAPRIRALMAGQREAETWRRAVSDGRREAYWTYMRRYPRTIHAAEARQALVRLEAPVEPIDGVEPLAWDIEPPIADEVILAEQIWRPDFWDSYERPPVFATYVAPPAPVFWASLPPPVFAGPGFLPVPVAVPFFVPVPVLVAVSVAAPVVITARPRPGLLAAPLAGGAPGAVRAALAARAAGAAPPVPGRPGLAAGQALAGQRLAQTAAPAPALTRRQQRIEAAAQRRAGVAGSPGVLGAAQARQAARLGPVGRNAARRISQGQPLTLRQQRLLARQGIVPGAPRAARAAPVFQRQALPRGQRFNGPRYAAPQRFNGPRFAAPPQFQRRQGFAGPRFVQPQAPRFAQPRFMQPRFAPQQAPRFVQPGFARPQFAPQQAPRFAQPRFAPQQAPRFVQPPAFARPQAPVFQAPRFAAPAPVFRALPAPAARPAPAPAAPAQGQRPRFGFFNR